MSTTIQDNRISHAAGPIMGGAAPPTPANVVNSIQEVINLVAPYGNQLLDPTVSLQDREALLFTVLVYRIPLGARVVSWTIIDSQRKAEFALQAAGNAWDQKFGFTW
jgi:hypothetical protein